MGEWTEASSDTYNTQDVEYVSVDSSGCMYIASRSYTYCDEIPEQQEDEDTTQDNGMEFCYDRQWDEFIYLIVTGHVEVIFLFFFGVGELTPCFISLSQILIGYLVLSLK